MRRPNSPGPFADRSRRYLEELLACHGVEEDLEIRSRIGFMAFHGGSLERETDLIAQEAAVQADASFYAVRQPPHLHWHIPSTLFRAAESAKLERFFESVDLVITVHGFRRRLFPRHVVLGGQNREFAAHVAETLRPRLPEAVIVDDMGGIPPPIRGVHPDNPVNVPKQRGVQVEIAPILRARPKPLVDGLAEAALSYAAA